MQHHSHTPNDWMVELGLVSELYIYICIIFIAISCKLLPKFHAFFHSNRSLTLPLCSPFALHLSPCHNSLLNQHAYIIICVFWHFFYFLLISNVNAVDFESFWQWSIQFRLFIAPLLHYYHLFNYITIQFFDGFSALTYTHTRA